MARYSRLDVCTAGNDAADLFNAASLDPDTVTIIDFMVNVITTKLEDPDADVEDVISEHWGDEHAEDAAAIRKLFTTNGQEQPHE